MQDSKCGGGDKIDVCCGSTINYLSAINSNPVTTKPIVHKNLYLLPPPRVCGRQVRLRQARIFGGNVTTLLDFPWMVILEFGSNETSYSLFCAGTLINESYVLTAAHCISRTETNIYGPVFRIRLGEYNTDTEYDCVNINEGTGNLPNGKKCADPIVHVDIDTIIIHPLFKDEPLGPNDIALLRLSKNINYTDFIKPICLPLNGEKSSPGTQMVIAGWGRTEQGKNSPVKRKAFVPVISDEECGKIYKEKAKVQLEMSQICAGGVRGIDSCTGDTGGVLMRPLTDSRDMYAEGIISFGPRYCGTEGIPAVATRVSHFIEWILNTIEP